jgi:hypothetical protein
VQGFATNAEHIDNGRRKAEARSREELHNLAVQKADRFEKPVDCMLILRLKF